MAGKFLSLEEAARRIGASVDEINRLVDRKELFPMRDGSTIKFKLDDIERLAADRGAGVADDLALEIELSTPGLGSLLRSPPSGGDDLVLGDSGDDGSIFAGGEEPRGGGAESQTVVRHGEAPPGSALASGIFDADDMTLESIVSASSASQHAAGQPSGTLAIDLGDLGGGSLAGSVPGLGSGSLVGAVDSGLSLEAGPLDLSGIDLDGGTATGSLPGSGVDEALGGSLVGDEFELGSAAGDEESASVVIPTEETGDSSFFGDAMDDSVSVSLDGSAVIAGAAAADVGDLDVPVSQPFTVWQVVGLVCCTLLMFIGGLVVFDVVATLRSPLGSPVSSPLLTGMAETFGW